ncbi:MAG: sialidase family protein [Nocardioidaceae bacterium]
MHRLSAATSPADLDAPNRPRNGGKPVFVTLAAGFVLCLSSAAAVASDPTPHPNAVVHVGQIGQQDVPALPGSEPDTLVEPDVAVSPVNSDVAVAVAHDGRYATGGAVGIEYAWTHDGGATWQHRPLPGLTFATGGPKRWIRASDPVAAFGPDGTAYVSTLLINAGCYGAVAVSRSTNGGQTFTPPVLAHFTNTCTVSDDKNWLVVDNSDTSPHKGRLYQFWTPFLTDMFGNPDGSPQAMVYSDDHGRTWSSPVNVSPPHANTQNSQPMLLPDGTIVDSYIDFGKFAASDGPEAAGLSQSLTGKSQAAPGKSQTVITTRISTNGGRTWKAGGTITRDLGGGAPGVRCCLPSATTDAVTGQMYAVWSSQSDPTKVDLSSSSDGIHWSAPVVVNPRTSSKLTVNADVSARANIVAVSFGLTNAHTMGGRFAEQNVAISHDGGATFRPPVSVGPRSNYAYAAQAGGIFPGDYIGSAMANGRLYVVWCVSSKPKNPAAKYHQVLYGATFGGLKQPVSQAPVG